MLPSRMLPRCAIALFVLIATHLSAANLVTNGGFESGFFAGWATIPAATGSNFGVGNTGPGTGGTGNFVAFFQASGGLNDAISQTFVTTPGSAYILSFFLNVIASAPANNDFRVFFDNTLVFSRTNINSGFGTFTIPVSTNSTLTTLRIEGRNARDTTFFDDISVNAAAVTVPETGGTALFLGLAAAGLICLRRRQLV